VKQEVRPGQTVLDVGANLGYYTLLFARAVGVSGRVFAFEPVEDNVKLLEQNIELNGYRNVTVIRKAVIDTTGLGQMFLSTSCCGNHTLFAPEENSSSVRVETISLDEYFHEYRGRIDFVKIDAEGAEGRIVRGMHFLLNENRHMKIVIEYWPFGLKKSGIPPREFLGFLARHEFELYRIDERSGLLVHSSPNDLLRNSPNDPGYYVNLLCVPYGTEPGGHEYNHKSC